jgi:hypothetical protein
MVVSLKVSFRGTFLRHLRFKQYYRVFFAGFLILLASSFCSAQKTSVQDAGPGLKQEFDSDAAGRVIQGRTLTTDGKLQVKVEYFYNARGDVDKQVSTHYWPDGKSVQKIAQSTYDENTNFTSEFVDDYNQAGKHFRGHQVYRDVMTGIYRCLEWKDGQQKYVGIDCPASEESREGPSEVRKITRDEVMQHLAIARGAAQAEQARKNTDPAQDSTTIKKEVGIVIPAQLRPGARVSGSIVENPSRFAGHPDLLVTRVTLPFPSAGDGSTLADWTFALKGAKPQSAGGSFSFVVPNGASTLEFTLSRSSDASSSVSGKLEVPQTKAPHYAAPKSYESAALCFKNDMCTVTGPFTGDSSKTFAAFDDVPVAIVAQTDGASYLDVPINVVGGSATLIIAEGQKVAAMVMVVASLTLEPQSQNVEPGQSFAGVVHVDNVGELADAQWRYGVYPPSNVAQARALVPGVNPARVVEQDREQREKQEKKDGGTKKKDPNEESAGMVLVVVRNATPDLATLRGAKQQSFMFHLVPESFGMGEFKFSFAIDPLKAGTVELQATAIPFLAPVKAEVFTESPAGQN